MLINTAFDQCDYCQTTIGVAMRQGLNLRLFKSCPTCVSEGFRDNSSNTTTPSLQEFIISGQFNVIEEQKSLIARQQERIDDQDLLIARQQKRIAELEERERESKQGTFLQPKSYLIDSVNLLGQLWMSELLPRRESMELETPSDSDESMREWASDGFADTIIGEELDDLEVSAISAIGAISTLSTDSIIEK